MFHAVSYELFICSLFFTYEVEYASYISILIYAALQ